MKIDWKAKLTSRKFWAAIVAVINLVCGFFGGNRSTTETGTALVLGGGGRGL